MNRLKKSTLDRSVTFWDHPTSFQYSRRNKRRVCDCVTPTHNLGWNYWVRGSLSTRFGCLLLVYKYNVYRNPSNENSFRSSSRTVTIETKDKRSFLSDCMIKEKFNGFSDRLATLVLTWTSLREHSRPCSGATKGKSKSWIFNLRWWRRLTFLST